MILQRMFGRGMVKGSVGYGSLVGFIVYSGQRVAVVVQKSASRTIICWLADGAEMGGESVGTMSWGLEFRD